MRRVTTVVRRSATWGLMFGVMVFAPGLGARAQAVTPSDAGCTQNKNIYTCNWETFRQVLASAHTVAVPVVEMDRFTAVQLRELAGALGKKVASRDEAADLVFSVVPVDTTGIDFGPRDRPLATLQVYALEPGSEHKTLLWVETYTGQADRPWAADVKALLDQFRERVKKR